MEDNVIISDDNVEKDRIVKKGLKCDFHIHSIYSKHKESKNITIDSTIENLDTLIGALDDNGVEMAAITDHDVFSYELYSEFRKKAKCLKLVLPGVEFTVAMKNKDLTEKQIHVITLFNNSDEEKVKNIEKVLGNGQDDKGNIKHPQYDALDKNAYSQDKLIKLLDEIGLDVVMIAHQKKSMMTLQKKEKNDFNTLDEEEQNYLLFTEYFQALEFHDKKNELFNIKKKAEFKNDILHFITGSDCHDWICYPNHDVNKTDADKFRFTYLKCLPTFRGVSLALTEDSRIKLDNSFFSVSKKYVDEISISFGNPMKDYHIPLSKGINAIIGDNSIGKSLLIHKITNYYRKDIDKETSAIDAKITAKYDKYLNDKGIKINTKIEQDKIYGFDSQGEIRKKFSLNKLDKSKFIQKRKKDNPAIEIYKNKLIEYANKYILDLKAMMDKNAIFDQLADSFVSIPENDVEARVLKGIVYETTDFDAKKTNKSMEIADFDKSINSLKGIRKYLTKEELENVDKFIKYLESLLEIRKNELKSITNTVSIIELINDEINSFNDNQSTTDDDKIIKQFNNQMTSLANLIVNVIEKKNNMFDFELPTMGEKIEIPSERYACGQLKIVTCSENRIIDDNYLLKLFKDPLNKDRFKKESFLSKDSLCEAIYHHDPTLDPWDEYKQLIIKKINEDFKEVIKINYLNEADDVDHSNGLNDTMYFEILSNDDINEGIYFIDQPEDDISQKSIRDNLISYLRKMGNNRQIILITHNPQFVVNLDVDNVIYLHKDALNNIKVHSGALEFQNKDENVDILSDVAETLDGGVMTIRKRWKKYEKNIEDIIR